MNPSFRRTMAASGLWLAACNTGTARPPPAAVEAARPPQVAAAPKAAAPSAVSREATPTAAPKPATESPPKAASHGDATKAPAKPAAKPAGSASPAAPKVAAQPAAPAPAKPAVQAAAPAPPTPAAAPAPLDLRTLEQRLKETSAIGVLTKLSLKNQVDDLIAKFRAYHAGSRPPTLPQLRPTFELLLMKVLSLLQDKDPGLARDIDKSRDTIWGVLTDKQRLDQFSQGKPWTDLATAQ